MNVGLNSGPSTLSNTLNGVIDEQVQGRANLTKCSTLDSSTAVHISFGSNTKSFSYAKLLNRKPSKKTINFCPLLAPTGNGADVAIFVKSVHVVHGRSSYTRAMVELRADAELKDTLLVDVPKFMGETYTISTIRVEYERTPPRCSSCKVFGHVLDECPKKIVSDVLKNSKSPRQDVEGVHVGLKLGSKVQFKLTKQVYQHVSKKNTASSSGRKKQAGLKSGTSSEAFATKKVDDPVNADSDSEGGEVFNKTDGYTESTSSKDNKSGSGLGNKNLYEQLKVTYNKDSYDDDDFDDCGLTDTQMKIANSFDICLRGQIR
ncbi:zinc knuckle CX2CX4HX4C containing protein [Tanacetum coccineum]